MTAEGLVGVFGEACRQNMPQTLVAQLVGKHRLRPLKDLDVHDFF